MSYLSSFNRQKWKTSPASEMWGLTVYKFIFGQLIGQNKRFKDTILGSGTLRWASFTSFWHFIDNIFNKLNWIRSVTRYHNIHGPLLHVIKLSLHLLPVSLHFQLLNKGEKCQKSHFKRNIQTKLSANQLNVVLSCSPDHWKSRCLKKTLDFQQHLFQF